MKLLVSSKRLDHSQMTRNCVRKLRWKDDVNHCKFQSDQRCKVRRWYSVTLLVFYTIHSLCLAMAERREEGSRSAPSIALGSWGKAAVFQDSFNPQHHIFETSIQLEGSMVGECLAWTSYFWGFHTCYSICFFCRMLKCFCLSVKTFCSLGVRVGWLGSGGQRRNFHWLPSPRWPWNWLPGPLSSRRPQEGGALCRLVVERASCVSAHISKWAGPGGLWKGLCGRNGTIVRKLRMKAVLMKNSKWRQNDREWYRLRKRCKTNKGFNLQCRCLSSSMVLATWDPMSWEKWTFAVFFVTFHSASLFCVLAWMTPTIPARFLKPCFVADEKILSLFPFLLAIWKSPFSQRPHSSELFQLLTSTSHRLEPQPVAVADGTSPSRNTSRGDFRDLWHTWWAKWEKRPVLKQLEVR